MIIIISPGTTVKTKQNEKGDKYQDLTKELKTMEHEGDSDTNCN